MMKKQSHRKGFILLQFLLMFFWLSLIRGTDAYYSPYLIVGILSFLCLFKNKNVEAFYKKYSVLECIFSALFSIAVKLANKPLFEQIANSGNNHVVNIIIGCLMLIGGFFIANNIFFWIKTNSKILKINKKVATHNLKPWQLFLICFGVLALIDILILTLCEFPGNLSNDSIDEIGQMLTGHYSNHHPFYFTILVKFFISLGMNLTGNINIGVFIFSLFQIFMMSGIFSYAMTTLYERGIPAKYLIIVTIFYAIMPFQISYSFTMWKDVLFSGSLLLVCTSIYRILNNVGKKTFYNYITLCLSGLCVCLYRTNGWYAFIFAFIIMFFMFRKKYKKLIITTAGIIITAFVLRGPVLDLLHVSRPDALESLSVPMQQITYTIKTHRSDLSENQVALIENVADIDDLINAYNPIIHDPIKEYVRSEGNKEYVTDHLGDFLKLYLDLGITHPADYVYAWVNQTRGYWNSGYNYWYVANDISENSYGIQKVIFSEKIHNLFSKYCAIFQSLDFLQIFVSIGGFIWALIILIYINIINKRWDILYLFVPVITLWLSLLIATPVFCEFRYIYALFMLGPFLTFATLFKK